MKRSRAWHLLVPLMTVGALICAGAAPASAGTAPATTTPSSTTPNTTAAGDSGTYTNPVTLADVPDLDVAYDGHAYYMVSTTMHMAPGVPIMRSTDLVHWSIVDYAGPILADTDALALRNGQNAYSQGSWAASIKFHNGTYYISVGSLTTGKTYIYSTPNIENGPWTRSVLEGYDHDQSLLFDGDTMYLVYGGGQVILRTLQQNADGTVGYAGDPVTLVDNANVDMTAGLNAEGSHAYKIGDYYYVFMIEWPSGGIRQEVVWRSTSLTPQSQGGIWEGKVVFSQRAAVQGVAGDGAAQGGVIQSPDGSWHAMLFQDEGPVGRSPQLADVTWTDGWPVYSLSATMNIPGGGTVSPPTDIVTSDDFENTTAKAGYWNTTTDASLTSAPSDAYNGSNLKLQWQWNHNPDNTHWSLTDRPGYLRLTTGSVATGILDARNTLTQRTYGPTSSGAVAMDVSQMKDGDVAGLAAFQRKYGYVGVTMSNGTKNIVMQRANSDGTVASTSTPIPLTASTVYLKVDTNYQNFANTASFYYSLDGTSWTKAGDNLAMEYTLPHFMGYRFGLFNYSTAATGGYVDFDYFHVSDQIGQGVATNPCTTAAAILDNGGFEAGTLAPWTGNGTAQLALTTDDKASGTSGVHVTGRTNTGDGPIQSVANELTPGAAYTVSAKVKYTTGPATKQFNVTVQDANYKAYIMASATVTRGQWTTISGSYTVPTSGLDLTTARVFVETVWTGTPDATNDLMDFSADDVSMSGASTAAFDGGLIDNGGFEAGTLAPWTGNGTAQLALTTDDKASGACSVHVTGRTKTGDGPIQSVANELTPGAAYTVSAKVKYTTGPATKQFNVTVQDANYKAYIMASATVTRGQWTTISGSYTVPTSGLDLTTARVFVETVWTGTPDATNDLMDFSVDDVSVSAATTTTHPKGTAKPAKTVGTSNPLMDYQYGADPSAMVYNGRLYEYMTSDGSQIDSDGSINQTYEFDGSGNIKNNSYGKIQTITVISSADMVNWTNHGQIKVAGQFGAAKWASNSWAPAATHKVINGKDEFFLYFANSAGGIGVLESESPVGPWRDPIGKALVTGSTPGVAGVVWLFDPAVLTADDGTSYLYFGGGVPSTNGTSTPAQQDHPQTARVITLGDDMVTTTGTAATIDAPALFEDSGINKIGDKYYYSYCTNFSHDNVIDGHTIGYGNIAYMVSDSPMGPFTYQGEILRNPGFFFGDGGNNHHTLFQFNGQWYVTYHAFTVQSALVAGGSLDKNHGYRSTQIDKVTINSDGTIAPITMTYQGISQQSSLDPYQRIEGETIAWDSGIQDAYVPSSGIRVAPLGSDNSDGQKLTNINGGEWTSLAGVDFGSDGAGGATGFAADVLPKAGGQIQIRLDSPDTASDADVVGTLDVPASSAGTWQKISTTLTKKVTGVHDVFFTFKGTGTDELFDVDDWTFTSDAVPTGPVILGVSVAEGAVVSGTKSFEVDLAGAASDVSYTYIELNRDGAWVTDNTTAAALALGSTNAGVKPKLVVDTTTLPNGAYGLKVDAVGTNGKTTEQTINFTVNNAPAKATSSTSAVVVPGKGRSPAKVSVTVSSAAKVTGTVKVTINKGTTKVTDKSASLSKGSVSIGLPKLATGTYTLVVDYKGSNTVAASTTTITYTVS